MGLLNEVHRPCVRKAVKTSRLVPTTCYLFMVLAGYHPEPARLIQFPVLCWSESRSFGNPGRTNTILLGFRKNQPAAVALHIHLCTHSHVLALTCSLCLFSLETLSTFLSPRHAGSRNSQFSYPKVLPTRLGFSCHRSLGGGLKAS